MPKARANGIDIHYKVEGQGEPLILIMGYSGTQESWLLQTRAFAKHYRVVTFDNRGVGKTDKPDGPYTTRMMADDTIGLMDHLEINKAHVLGVSMGGMIAQELAINYPERVCKLVLGCTFAGRDDTSGYSLDIVRALGGEEGYSDEDVINIPIRKLTNVVVALSFNKRLYRMILVPLAKIGTRLSGTRGLVAQFEACQSHNTLDRLHLIQAPTLVIAGTQDRVISPLSSEVLANTIPNVRLVRVEGGAHAFFVEMRGRFNKEVLNFFN